MNRHSRGSPARLYFHSRGTSATFASIPVIPIPVQVSSLSVCVYIRVQVSDVAMAWNMTTLMIAGPTTSHGLPPFSWTPPFDTMSHVGFPTVYNFDWVLTKPEL